MLYKTLTIEENIPLAPFSTFQVGGPARYFARVSNETDLQNAILFARNNLISLFVLGGGSNIVISDEGFPGLVVLNSIKGFEVRHDENGVLVYAGAGEEWDGVVGICVDQNLAGIECLSGIPGTVGGAVVQNIGAYGQSIQEAVETVRAIHVKTGEATIFTNKDCLFRYRDSLFKSSGAGQFVVSGVSFRLTPNGMPNISYHDIKNYFSRENAAPSLVGVRKAVIHIRGQKGFVLLPGYPHYQSAGSFFKNPVLSEELFNQVRTKILYQKDQGGCKDPWFWVLPSGGAKVSAACLIERAGFVKGYRIGNVGLSPHHPLAIINYGQASAREIVDFAENIQKNVQEKFGVLFEPEVLFVGFSEKPLQNSPR